MDFTPRIMRSVHGCWTCRLRRKKCDEQRPVCETCAALRITCHYEEHKPEWMDGGARQEEMVDRLKREVKEKAPYRRVERLHIPGQGVIDAGIDEWIMLPQTMVQDPMQNDIDGSTEPPKPTARGTICTHIDKYSMVSRSDSILIMFYFEHVLPFLFPFYHPPVLMGGTAWVLDIMVRSSVVRQATLCQSSFFFCLVQGTASRNVICETVFTQVREAFETLGRTLQIMDGSDISENLHGAVQIMASMVQMLRFEIAALTFENCHAHLNAALALFDQLLDASGVTEPAVLRSRFDTFMLRLGPSSWIPPAEHVMIPSAEQAAFSFSTTLLLFDDIIASTVLQKRPRLYKYHQILLEDTDGSEAAIDFETVIGCQNWVILQVGEIATLDEWKQECQSAGKLNMIELVSRATPIKELLEAHLMRLEGEPFQIRKEPVNLMGLLTSKEKPSSPGRLVTLVWTHAALVYLFVVVSGWQPASAEVQSHVNRIIELLAYQLSPPELLRTLVWPFCVAGCLAEPVYEAQLRGMVEALQPSIVFSTVRKALEIMENAWCNRDISASRDLAACFKSQGDMVLLV